MRKNLVPIEHARLLFDPEPYNDAAGHRWEGADGQVHLGRLVFKGPSGKTVRKPVAVKVMFPPNRRGRWTQGQEEEAIRSTERVLDVFEQIRHEARQEGWGHELIVPRQAVLRHPGRGPIVVSELYLKDRASKLKHYPFPPAGKNTPLTLVRVATKLAEHGLGFNWDAIDILQVGKGNNRREKIVLRDAGQMAKILLEREREAASPQSPSQPEYADRLRWGHEWKRMAGIFHNVPHEFTEPARKIFLASSAPEPLKGFVRLWRTKTASSE